MKRPKALFVAYSNHLGAGNGGVQKCTVEFIRVLEAAGLDLEIMAVEPDRRLSTRLVRRLAPSQYWRPIARDCLAKISAAFGTVEILLLNQVSLAGAIPAMKLGSPGPSIILLSHGCEITDLLHLARLAPTLPLSAQQLGPIPQLTLARTLQHESQARALIDGAICISPYDADTESWLGTPAATWIPRAIDKQPLRRNPIAGRFGFVGTLDHAPNLEGLVAVLKSLQDTRAKNLTIRVVGGPPRIGEWLAQKFSNIAYLGELDNEELRREAQTWSAFLHPIFCLPRGCSTKITTALSWSMPIITTPAGRRGYIWKEGSIVEVNSPSEFVAAMHRFEDASVVVSTEHDVLRVTDSSPNIEEIGASLRGFFKTMEARNAQ